MSPSRTPADIDDGVVACTSQRTVLVSELHDARVTVVETRLDGTRVKVWFEQSSTTRPAVDVKRGIAVGVNGLVSLGEGKTKPIDQASDWAWPVLLPGRRWVVSPLIGSSASGAATIELFDVDAMKLVRSVNGYAPSVAPDGAVLYLRGSDSSVDVMRLYPAPRKLKTIALHTEGGPYSIPEVVALGGRTFLYRAYDEHEFRYYDELDRPFFPGPEGHWVDRKAHAYHQGGPREQYDLVVADAGDLAAFAERRWNELTYLVVVDRRHGVRTQLPYYGSFPAIDGPWVLFVSDPSFVTTGHPEFRQIVHYALYAYDTRVNSLCRVARYESPVAAYTMR